MRYGEFFSVWLFTALSPGSTSMLIMAQSLRGGMRAALRGVLGIMAGHAVYISLLYSGLQLSGQGLPSFLPWLQRAGALYLAYSGLEMLWQAWKPGAEAVGPKRPGLSPFQQAFLTHLSNPRVLLFTFSLLPAYLQAGQPLLPQLLPLAATMMAVDALVMCGYAALAAQGAGFLKENRKWIDTAAGILILWVGLRLLLQ